MSASETEKTMVEGAPLDDKIQIGQKYGEWKVTAYAGKVRYAKEGRLVSITDVWSLECSCGATKHQTRGNILTHMQPTSRCPACEGKRRKAVSTRKRRPTACYKKWRQMGEDHTWPDYETFVAWMEQQSYHGRQLTRIDPAIPHGPGNTAFEQSIKPKYDQALEAIAASTGQTLEEVMEWGSTVTPSRVYQRAASLSPESTGS